MHGRKHTDPDVLIIGAGLAGLCCGLHLHKEGISFLILEASDGIGGRVRTDQHDGFLLDRGFQVIQTAYPEARRLLDYQALKLRPFHPGALVRFNGRFCPFYDIWRRPQRILESLRTPIGTLADKMRLGRLRLKTSASSLPAIFAQSEQTTIAYLRNLGFSESMIARFLRPFFSGVFLDRDLQATSRMFEFVFRMFGAADVALPAAGMQAIPDQIASRIPEKVVTTGFRVEAIRGQSVVPQSGKQLSAKAIVIATDGPEVERLLDAESQGPSKSVCCLYFSAEAAPLTEPVLILNGEGSGPVNNLCVPSQVSPSYSGTGRALISVTVLGAQDRDDGRLEGQVRAQLTGWFGPIVRHWQHLRTYRISHALPPPVPPSLSPYDQPVRVRRGLYVCGEYQSLSSIQWAMFSGRRAAEAVLEDMAAEP
jgi:phytoene dehydrogenase-like protein